MTALPQRVALYSTLLLVGIGAALAAWGAAFLSLTFFSLSLTFFSTLPVATAVMRQTLSVATAVMRQWLGPDVGPFYCAAALASLLLGPLFWWRFIIRAGHLTLGRGILVGVLVSLVAHPLTWFLATDTYIAAASLSRRQTDLLLLILSNPLGQLVQSLDFSLLSLLYVGWITSLVGGVVGGLLALVQRAFMVRQAGLPDG